MHYLPDDLNCIQSNNLISDNHNKLNTTDEINENSKSNRSRRKQSSDRQRIDEDTDTSCIKKRSLGAKKLSEVIKTHSAATNELKYKAIHSRIREKTSKKDASNSKVEKTNNRNNSSLTTANDQTCQISMINNSISNTTSTLAVQSSSTDWTRMIEFGKETKHGRKRKMKKLNVSTEKNKDTPRIIKNVSLSPSKKYNLSKIVKNNNTSKKKVNNQKENAIDKYLELSNAKVMPSQVSSETDTRNQKECTKDNINSSTLLSPNLSIEMQKKEQLLNLTNSQVNEIIGFENINKNSQASQSQCHEERAEIVVEHYNLLLSSPKRLTILTPEKLNESVREHEIIRNITQTPVSNFGNSSPAENQTFEPEKNNGTQRIVVEVASSQSLQSPTSKTRLSLKRKSGIEDKKKIDSPLLGQVPLIGKLSIIEKNDIDDCRNVDSPISKNGKLFDRLTTIKRDLNLEMIDKDQLQTNRNTIPGGALSKRTTDKNASRIICQDKKLVSHPMTSKKSSKNINNQGCPVKFLQMGTMIRRRNVKYFYLGTTKRKQSIPAEVYNITSVHNMQQSINKFDMLQYNITTTSCNLARSPDRSNDSQDTMDMMENIASVTRTISRGPELSAASTLPRKILMPKRDIDHQKKTVIENVTEKSAQSPHKTPHAGNSAIKKISHVYSRTSNSIKLLSPDEDSQLKFLAIDSPMSEHGESRRANSTRQQSELEKPIHTKENNFSKAKNSHFTPSTSKAQEPSIENFDRKKRMRYINDKELFDDNRNDNSSDSASDIGRRGIKLNKYNRSSKNAESDLDMSKKHRSSFTDDQDVIEIISLDSKKQDTRTRKFRRILAISSSDTESESAEHVARNCKRY